MKDILSSYSVSELRKIISSTNIKGYSKMKKDELIKLMMKPEHKDKFKNIKMKSKIAKKKDIKLDGSILKDVLGVSEKDVEPLFKKKEKPKKKVESKKKVVKQEEELSDRDEAIKKYGFKVGKRYKYFANPETIAQQPEFKDRVYSMTIKKMTDKTLMYHWHSKQLNPELKGKVDNESKVQWKMLLRDKYMNENFYNLQPWDKKNPNKLYPELIDDKRLYKDFKSNYGGKKTFEELVKEVNKK